MHVWINGVLYLFTEMMETCQQLKSQWLHQILTQGSQKCRKNKLEKKKKTGKIQRADVGIIQILWKNCCIIVIFSVEWNMWKKIHNSTYRVSKSQWACFFFQIRNGKVTEKWHLLFYTIWGKNITLMSSDILLQYIFKISAIQDCSGPLSWTLIFQ